MSAPLTRSADAESTSPQRGEVNIVRGEAALLIGGAAFLLRPSFAALVAVEGELGSLFALVERAASQGLLLGEIVALFWHCLERRDDLTREALGEAIVVQGLSGVTPALKTLLRQILSGQ